MHLIKRFLIVFFMLASLPALAGKDDFDKPIEVANQSQFFDVKRKISVLQGNVSIKQGSLLILADEMEILGRGDKSVEKFIAKGSPASYKQSLDDGSELKASANNIEYDVDSRTITLSGNAQVEQNDSQVNGESITINMRLEQVFAKGNKDEQVKTIFQPGAFKKDTQPQSKKQKSGDNQP